MVYAKLAYLALIASLYQVSDAQSMRRARPGCVAPQFAPRVPVPTPYRSCDMISDRYRYECNLEDIISKLINALIYTILRKDGSGAGGGSGGAGGGSGGGVGGADGGGAGGSNGSGGGAGSDGSESSGLLKSLLALDLSLSGTDLDDVASLTQEGYSTNAGQQNTRSNFLISSNVLLNGKDIVGIDLIGG